jgi:hypothetical protein
MTGEDSIKFLDDVRAGVWDFKDGVVYTQSMVNEAETFRVGGEQVDPSKISAVVADKYRDMLVKAGEKKKSRNLDFQDIGRPPAHDEF